MKMPCPNPYRLSWRIPKALLFLALLSGTPTAGAQECPAGAMAINQPSPAPRTFMLRHQTLAAGQTQRYCLPLAQPAQALQVKTSGACSAVTATLHPPASASLPQLSSNAGSIILRGMGHAGQLSVGTYVLDVTGLRPPAGCAGNTFDVLWTSTPTSAASSPAGSPTLHFTAAPSSIQAGQSATLSWSSTNATSCTASGGWTGSKAPSGTQIVTPTATTTYTLQCTGPGGTSPAAQAIVQVTVPAPTLTVGLSANPAAGTAPLTSTLTATLGGTATGTATVKFDCTNDGIWDNTDTSAPYTFACQYAEGDHTAKAEATRGGLPPQTAMAAIHVGAEFACPDGILNPRSDFSFGKSNVTFQEGRTYQYCFDLPPRTWTPNVSISPYVDAGVVNLGNASCSDLEMTLRAPASGIPFANPAVPSGLNVPREYFSYGPQPGAILTYIPGRWQLAFKLNWGCDRYNFRALVPLLQVLESQ